MCKEIKVQIKYGENDSYVELWKVINERKYYGRYTYGNEGTWYYVSDPLGYCELDRPVEDDVMFIICDENGNECVRYSNADGNKLPKFETVIKAEWKKVRENISHNVEDFSSNFWASVWNGDTTMKINQWLLSFKDPDLYPEKAKDYDENWTSCWAEKEISYEPIPNTEFEYLGNKYQFTKVTHKHDYAGVEWIEFVCTDSPYQIKDTPWVKDRKWIASYMYLGNWFDETIQGTMYDQRTARELVIKRLLKTYPREKDWSKLLYVNVKDKADYTYCVNTCTEMSYSDVADLLIKRDLHKKSVDQLCKYIKSKTKGKIYPSNRKSKAEIKALYPDIYGYDYCLI